MRYTLNQLIENFVKNLSELRALLKLPEKYENQAKFAKKELDRFFLPLSIQRAQEDLKNPPKGVSIEKIKKYLNNAISEYRKLEPENIDKNGKILLKVDEKYFSNFDALKKQREKFQHSISHKIHIEKAVLFNLISYLEQSLSDVSHIILKEHPEILQLNDKNLTFDEIKKCDSLDDAKEFLVSQEIEKLLFKPLSDFFDFFEKKVFKIEFSNLSKFRNELIEIKERRNLLIHNGGIVNSKYLNTVEKSLQGKFKIKKDEEISLGKKYLEECIEKIELIGLELLFFASIKFQNGEEKEKAIWKVNSIIYETFAKKSKNYFLGERLSIFILEKCQKYLTEQLKDYFKLNYWHILKKQEKLDSVKIEISKYDTSSKNHIIQLCFFGLTNNFKEAYKHITPSLNEEEFNLEAYEDFPILEDLRKNKEAKKIIEKYKKENKKKTNE